MNRNIVIDQLAWQASMLLVIATPSVPALAQTPPVPAPTSAVAAAAEPVRIGDATRQLLSMQRNAAGSDRPIPGEQAGLSYQRYLDSFKHPIPERTGSSISSTGGPKAQ